MSWAAQRASSTFAAPNPTLRTCAPQEKKLPPIYRGKWASASQAEVDEMLAKGVPHCYRFRVPKSQVVTIQVRPRRVKGQCEDCMQGSCYSAGVLGLGADPAARPACRASTFPVMAIGLIALIRDCLDDY